MTTGLEDGVLLRFRPCCLILWMAGCSQINLMSIGGSSAVVVFNPGVTDHQWSQNPSEVKPLGPVLPLGATQHVDRATITPGLLGTPY